MSDFLGYSGDYVVYKNLYKVELNERKRAKLNITNDLRSHLYGAIGSENSVCSIIFRFIIKETNMKIFKYRFQS